MLFFLGHYYNDSKSHKERNAGYWLYMSHNDGATARCCAPCTYRSMREGRLKTKQQGMICGRTAAQKSCAAPNKAGFPAASASSHITFQVHQHRFTHTTVIQSRCWNPTIWPKASDVSKGRWRHAPAITLSPEDLKLWMAACSADWIRVVLRSGAACKLPLLSPSFASNAFHWRWSGTGPNLINSEVAAISHKTPNWTSYKIMFWKMCIMLEPKSYKTPLITRLLVFSTKSC